MSYGDYYARGKNTPRWSAGDSVDWSISSSARRWPCAEGYHVPSREEWVGIVVGLSVWDLQKTLLLPVAGASNSSSSFVDNQGSYGYYRSSSPYSSSTAYFLYIYLSIVNVNVDVDRDLGFSVRCFKD
jgi:hypothetical protein